MSSKFKILLFIFINSLQAGISTLLCMLPLMLVKTYAILAFAKTGKNNQSSINNFIPLQYSPWYFSVYSTVFLFFRSSSQSTLRALSNKITVFVSLIIRHIHPQFPSNTSFPIAFHRCFPFASQFLPILLHLLFLYIFCSFVFSKSL